MYQLEVDADFVATQMYSLICGNNVTNTDKDNKCDINSIAAPDNLSMMRGHNQMIIGEDTEDHQNDVVWLYSFDVSFTSSDMCSCFALLCLLAIVPLCALSMVHTEFSPLLCLHRLGIQW